MPTPYYPQTDSHKDASKQETLGGPKKIFLSQILHNQTLLAANPDRQLSVLASAYPQIVIAVHSRFQFGQPKSEHTDVTENTSTIE